MKMSPEIFTAVCAGVTLLIYFTVTIIGGVVALFKKIDRSRTETIAYIDAKHKENNERYEALNVLVLRHDLLLNPEFLPMQNGKHHAR